MGVLSAASMEAHRLGPAALRQRKSGLAQCNETWAVGIRMEAALRRAHFHLFRYGAMTLTERPLRLRWLLPIPVKLDLENEDLPITVQEVEA